METTKRIFALVLLLSMLVCMFASCKKDDSFELTTPEEIGIFYLQNSMLLDLEKTLRYSCSGLEYDSVRLNMNEWWKQHLDKNAEIKEMISLLYDKVPSYDEMIENARKESASLVLELGGITFVPTGVSMTESSVIKFILASHNTSVENKINNLDSENGSVDFLSALLSQFYIDEAEVEEMCTLSFQAAYGDGSYDEGELYLVKIDGKWKVADVDMFLPFLFIT